MRGVSIGLRMASAAVAATGSGTRIVVSIVLRMAGASDLVGSSTPMTWLISGRIG